MLPGVPGIAALSVSFQTTCARFTAGRTRFHSVVASERGDAVKGVNAMQPL